MISSKSIRFQLLLSTAAVAIVQAPASAQVVHDLPVVANAGGATINSTPNSMSVGLNAPRTIILWDSFDINTGNSVNFQGPDPIPPLSVLNRVTGTDSSDILGSLTSASNVELLLINRNGILFGNGAQVDVGSLIASTLDINDADYMAGGILDAQDPTDPNLYYIFEDSVDTGVTVAGSAQVATSSGKLQLLGAFVDVQSGGVVNSATGVGLSAGNEILVPADPGSPVSFSIREPTPVANAITIGGQVSGTRAVAFMEAEADAQDALLLVTDTGSITATKDGGGSIILGMGARTTAGDIVDSPGRVENNGALTATIDIILSGAVSNGVLHRVREVENNGTIDAGDDVLMQARQNVTNTNSITAGDDVTMSAFASGTNFAPDFELNVTNSGDITAGGDVFLSAIIDYGDFSTEDDIAIAPGVHVVNSGTIIAGSSVYFIGQIDLASFSAFNIDVDPNVELTNSGAITAGNGAYMFASIDISDFAGTAIEMTPNLEVNNSGTISAGSSAYLDGTIDLASFNAQDINVAPNLEITNSGSIAADASVYFTGQISVTNFSAYASSDVTPSIQVSPSLEITNSGSITADSGVGISANISITDLSIDYDNSSISGTPNLEVTNSGSITAGDGVSIDAGIWLSEWFSLDGPISVTPNLAVSNSGSISADSDVNIAATMNLIDLQATDVAANVNQEITNSGSISAGGDVNLTAGIDFFDFDASEIDVMANMAVTNSGSITAEGGDVGVVAGINIGSTSADTPALSADNIDLTLNQTVTNSGSITADGGVSIVAGINLSGVEAFFDLDVTANMAVMNSGSITADSGVSIVAGINLSDLTASTDLGVTANMAVSNSGTISAGSDVEVVAAINLANLSAYFLDATLNNAVLNSGSIIADGGVSIGAGIDLSNFLTFSNLDVTANLAVMNGGTISAGSDVDVVAGVNLTNLSGPLLDAIVKNSVLNSGTIIADGGVSIDAGINLFDVEAIAQLDVTANMAVMNSGSITADGGDVGIVAGIHLSSIVAPSVEATLDAAVTNSGSITADGDVNIVAEIDTDFIASALDVSADMAILNSGTILAGGDVNVTAEINSPFTSIAQNVQITNSGRIDADGNGNLISDGSIANSGVISVDGVATLDAADDIDNSGSVAAGGDAILTAGGDILDSSGTLAGTISGADVALSAGGSITAGSVTARDDIAIRAPVTVTTRSLISGATIGGNGPVDVAGAADDLVGQTLPGHDVDVDGTVIYAGVIRAIGAGSDIRLGAPVSAVVNDLDFFAGGDITIEGPASGIDVALEAGGTITAGDISARDDIALRAGGTVDVGLLQSGVTIDGLGPVDQAGSADTLLARTLLGHDIFVQAAEVSLDQPMANGPNSDLIVRATIGDINIINGQAGGDIDFAAAGDITVVGATNGVDVAMDAGGTIIADDISARDDIALRAGETVNVGLLQSGVTIGGLGPVDQAGSADALLAQTLLGHDLFVQAAEINHNQATANGTNSDLIMRATTGDLTLTNGQAGGNVDLDAAQLVTVGTVVALAGNVTILADDLDILGGVTGSQVLITNRSGGNALTVLGDASGSGAFTLTGDEINRINASVLSVDSLDQNMLVGNVTFDNEVGTSRVNLLGTARIDIIGKIDASGVMRALQIGGTSGAADPNDLSTLASIIRMAPMSSGGGRIILGGGSLDLRGAKIGVGLDDGFLQPLGLIAGSTPVSTQVVQEDWIANLNSTLYGIPGGYTDPIVISAGSIIVTYADYALFQNTGSPSHPSGVNSDLLQIVSSGNDGNGFELFGTIDQIGGRGASLLVEPTTVSMINSRVNGCLIVTGGGCGGGGSTDIPTYPTTTNPTADPDPPNNGFSPSSLSGDGGNGSFAEQELVSTDESQAFDFDSLVGTNNEGLLGVMGVDDAPEQCAPDDKRPLCKTEEKPDAQ